MSFTFQPRHAALAALLAAGAFAAQAQSAPPMGPGPGQGAMPMHEGRGDPARMQERMQEHMQRRFERLKRILQITPAQEGAWNAWAAAMRPSPQAMQQRRAMHEEMERLTTPQRIDRMRQFRAEHMAEMDRRADATKTFYGQLTPSQQKAFDEVSLRFFARGHGHRGGMRGM